MRTYRVFVVVLALLSSIRGSHGLATEQVGPESAQREPTIAQPGWPMGITELLRHESRVYSIWVNGNENFYFKASPEGINDLIRLFSETRMRDHELWIKAGNDHVKAFNGDMISYNAELHVLGGIARGMARRDEGSDTYEPTLTLLVDPAADQAFWTKITLPDHVILHSEVAQCPLMGRAAKPQRKVWFAQVQFDDATPACDFEDGVTTRVTLWERGVKAGIKLGEVGHDGYFHAAFSEKELAALKTGASWLTLTMGNWATEAREDDPRLSIDRLSLDKRTGQPVKIAAPQFYYGRILFGDGSPPVLDPAPWPGAEIHVDFSYAGSARVDSQGYFKVYFSREQYEMAKIDRSRENIYIPDYESKGTSTARFEFPVSKLSRNKELAGVVKIPRRGP